MEIDFPDNGVCHVRQDRHAKYIIDSWPKKFKNTYKVSTPVGLDLFYRDSGTLLNEEKSETFHSVIAKGIFICT